jgi:hypothetical protein
MHRTPRILAATFLTAALALTAACGGGSGEEQTSSVMPPEDSSALLVADPSQALGRSVDLFEEDVESVEALFSFAIETQGITFGADGRFSYVAPDSIYMLLNMSGGGAGIDLSELGEFEVLLLGDELYMNTGFTGWVTMPLDDFEGGADALEALRDSHTPLDYQTLIDSVGGQVENVGTETVDGKTITRLRITTDLATLMNSISDSVGNSGGDESLFPTEVSGPMTMDILIDPATLLPYKLEAKGEFAVNGQTAGFAMTFRFFNYNGTVIIPEPPADAKPFDQFSDEFGSFDAYD